MMLCLECKRRPIVARGRCNGCYHKARRSGTIDIRRRGTVTICAVPGCEKRAIARGWCRNHYQHFWMYGTPYTQKDMTHE